MVAVVIVKSHCKVMMKGIGDDGSTNIHYAFLDCSACHCCTLSAQRTAKTNNRKDTTNYCHYLVSQMTPYLFHIVSREFH